MAEKKAVEKTGIAGRLGVLDAMARPSLLLVGAVLLTLLAALADYAITAGPTSDNPGQSAYVVGLVLVILALGLALGALIAWRLVMLWSERRSGRAGAKLHVRLVAMFCAVAMVPAIVMAVFAAVTLNLGVQSWFSSRVQTTLDNAVNVARQYVLAQEYSLAVDALFMADGIQRDGNLFDKRNHVHVDLMVDKLTTMTKDRGLAGFFLLDSSGQVLASTTKISYARIQHPSAADIAYAGSTGPVLDGNADTGIVQALIHLPALNDAYLLIVRQVDPKVFGYFENAKKANGEYRDLKHRISRVQLAFIALYFVASLAVLLFSAWLGLWAANRLVKPISSLIGAAERVSEGDLKAQVEVGRDDDEIGTLGKTFNRMTQQLDSQRSALMEANSQIDERRRFTETVLEGVSAGVIGLDAEGQITIVNRAAARLLNATPEELRGQHYSEAVPELSALIRRALGEPAARAGGEVSIKRGGKPRSLSVQVASEHGQSASGYVVTFDDITDLVSAQRTAAWADVARRIAHEIKNPLTPIQLSAERLKRKYGKEVGEDREVFEQCTDTIIRQVGDIGRMVDEFSSFARMPVPVMKRECAQELVQQAVFLQRVAHPEIVFETHLPKELVWFEADGRLVAQALTNVLKNATESIAARIATGDDLQGRIAVTSESDEATLSFRILDNGIGLPPEHRHRLTEPYVTTRAKGTGLGLAIVRKIMEDHGGEIVIADAGEEAKGAQVTLTFPLKQKFTREKGVEDEQARSAARV